MTREPSALQRLRDLAPRLNPTAQRVAEVILADPLRAQSASITDLAAASEASAATVSRLASKLGYPGFPAFRSAIALENGRATQSGWERDIGSAITPSDSPETVLDTLAGTAARSLREAADTIDVRAFERAARTIARADHVHLHGEWGDAIALRELQMRLLRIGIAAWFHEAGGHTLRAVANTLTERDAVIVLGRSGTDAATLDFLRRARTAGADTIALHGDPDSPLAEAADLPLYSGIRNGTVWTQYYAGRASDILATSLLWLLVAQHRSVDPTKRYVDDGTFAGPVAPADPKEPDAPDDPDAPERTHAR
ncbi:MurR/RpiR family transcriptional regulator [Brachybacterium subflavum]|uniref:MurR/RpiR family transcriptional regulator n=1 Tax=Brachybacterium subflavum TaxID=2585206 RepID=UPI00126615B2|nr:MurR/RpiR family transcriptional regulator [Brachybacterium subflavum]